VKFYNTGRTEKRARMMTAENVSSMAPRARPGSGQQHAQIEKNVYRTCVVIARRLRSSPTNDVATEQNETRSLFTV